MTLENFKIQEAFRHAGNFNFSEIISDEFWLKVKLLWNKNLCSEAIYLKKAPVRNMVNLQKRYSISKQKDLQKNCTF